MKKLTNAQRDVLARAAEHPDGRLGWLIHPRTLDILRERGLIERRLRYNDSKQESIKTDLHQSLDAASEALLQEEWSVVAAHASLMCKLANQLNAQADFITDAGREVLQ